MTGAGSPTPSPPGSGGGRPSEVRGAHLPRVLPIAQSVLWHPTAPGVGPRRPPGGPYPVFFDQKAIAAVHAHYETAGRQGMMGFLVGDLCECPTSHVRYAVIDSTIRLNQAVYGDKTLVIVSRLWDRIQDELQKTDGHLIGWYHSHPPIAVELAPGDVETHLQYFKRPWHVALVLGAEHEGPVAGLFRPGPGDTAPTISLPFYELIESDEGFAGGKKQSMLPWINFLSDDAAVVHGEPAPPPAVAQPPVRSTIETTRPSSPPARPAGTQARPALTAPAAEPPAQAASPPAPPPRPPPLPPLPPPPVPPPAPRFVQVPVSGPGGKRPAQMKPPPNALSSLPLLAAGGYDVGEVETRDSDPGVVTPRPQDHVTPPAPRRRPSQTPKPFAPALAPRRRAGGGGVVLALFLLVAGGAAAVWYFVLRRPEPPVTNVMPVTPVTPAPSAAPAAATDSALRVFDRTADSVSVVVRGYTDRVLAFGSAPLDCAVLSRRLVAVEDVWTTYNMGKRTAPALDAARTTRDQALYATVDSVEHHYDRSGCERP